MFKAAMFAVSVAGMGLTGAVAAGDLLSDAGVPAPGRSLVEAMTPAPAMGWHLLHEGERAKLAYGVANSDQIALMMSCAPGDGAVEVFGVVHPDTPRLTLAADAETTELDGAPEVDPITGAMAVETRAPIADPVLQRFKRGGDLAVVGRGERKALGASGEERRRIADFFAHCDRART